MVSKVVLAVLVLSLAYASEAIMFQTMFPGLNIKKVSQCKTKHNIEGGTSTIEIGDRNNGYENSRKCAKDCYKKRNNGQKKGDIRQHIVGSTFDWQSYGTCTCIVNNGDTPVKFVAQDGLKSCIYREQKKKAANSK